MIRVGFTGVPGAGKTSTARAVAAMCRKDTGFKNIELVSEYARRYISKYGNIETLWDQYWILQKQLDWEDKVGQEVDLIITDSPIYLGFLYCLDCRDYTKKDTMLFNEIFTQMNTLNFPHRYDIVFHLPPKLKPVDDGIRASHQFDDTWRKEADEKLRYIHNIFPPAKLVIIEEESMLDRINACLKHLQYLKPGLVTAVVV
jgi:nicotinamide riboside kinase